MAAAAVGERERNECHLLGPVKERPARRQKRDFVPGQHWTPLALHPPGSPCPPPPLPQKKNCPPPPLPAAAAPTPSPTGSSSTSMPTPAAAATGTLPPRAPPPGTTIEVSLSRPARPPLPSNVFVHCPGLDPGFAVLPRVVRAVEDLFLLRVAIDRRPDHVYSPDDPDDFIYRAVAGGTKGEPSLQRLPSPHPSSHDHDVGLLRRGSGHYTVAALIGTGAPDVYDLHLFHSATESPGGGWIYRKVSVGEPQQRFPMLIPENCDRLHYHDTSTVIAIGGEGGTMGWVDLWHGILVCDVLADEPTLRGVPLPLPLDLVSCNNGLGVEIGCPQGLRGIAFIKRAGNNTEEEGYLKLVHLEAQATQFPDETGSPSYRMHNWAIVTYTNTKMTSSWKDWHWERRVQASDITIDSQIHSQLLQSGLLLQKQPRVDGAAAAAERALQNLLVSDPIPAGIIDADDEDVVYLMARVKLQHPKAWVLALDLRNKTLLGAAEFGTERQPFSPAMYCPSTISKYMANRS